MKTARYSALKTTALAPVVLKLFYSSVPSSVSTTTSLGTIWADPLDHTQVFSIGGVPINFTSKNGLWTPWARNGEIETSQTVFGFQPLTDTDFQPRSAYVLPSGKTWSDIHYFRMAYFGLPSELNDHVFVIYDKGDTCVAYALTSSYNTTSLDEVLTLSIKLKLHGVDSGGADIIQCAEMDLSGRVTSGEYNYGGMLALNEYTPASGASSPYFSGIRAEVVFSAGATGAVSLASPITLIMVV